MKLEVLRIMNNASFVGRLVRDVNFSISQSNIEIANGTIAVNRPFKSQDGEYQADFINFVGFRNTAKILNQYTAKGNQVGMSGRMQSRTYENKQGQTVHVTELVVENVTLLDSNRNNDNQDAIHSQSQTNQSRGGYGGSTGYQGGTKAEDKEIIIKEIISIWNRIHSIMLMVLLTFQILICHSNYILVNVKW